MWDSLLPWVLLRRAAVVNVAIREFLDHFLRSLPDMTSCKRFYKRLPERMPTRSQADLVAADLTLTWPPNNKLCPLAQRQNFSRPSPNPCEPRTIPLDQGLQCQLIGSNTVSSVTSFMGICSLAGWLLAPACLDIRKFIQ